MVGGGLCGLLLGIYDRVVYRVIQNAEYAEDLIMGTNMEVVSNILMIPLAICAIKVIKDYRRMEERITELYNTPFEEDEDQVIAVTGESVNSVGIK